MTRNARPSTPMRIVTWSPGPARGGLADFMSRPAFDEKAEAAARRILAAVRAGGREAVARFARRFDGAALRPADLRVRASEIEAARARADAGLRRAAAQAHRRIRRFALAGMRRDWRLRGPDGEVVGERFVPLDRVGVYVPSAAAPLVSTALMTVTLAKAAGVPQIVACTPCGPDGKVNSDLLYCLDLAGADEIYRVGGVHAIGLMAFGAGPIRKVQKIVGPGGAFVTAAKRCVYGHVALDLVAGPSEVAVLADAAADPRCVAADLLSQAEHGTGFEKVLLATPSRALARAVNAQIAALLPALSRAERIRRVLERGALAVIVPSLDAGMDLCNAFAPEHLEIQTRSPMRWVRKVRRAGAVFAGGWTPEAVGDFVAGPSHVLPTGGTAAQFSGLTVDDFRRRTSVICYTGAALRRALPALETFGRVEGLDAHALSGRVRFGSRR